jgi:hypothetical protein
MARLQCPRCGAGMNRHAEKLVYGESAAELVDAPGAGTWNRAELRLRSRPGRRRIG